jgi:hypothetical protein
MSECEIVDSVLHPLVTALVDADPAHKMFHLNVNKRNEICIWRRAEWNKSYTKTLVDEERKKKLMEQELEYQHAKKVVMDFYLEVFPGDRAQAEKMMMPMCNNPKLLIAKAKRIEMSLGLENEK